MIIVGGFFVPIFISFVIGFLVQKFVIVLKDTRPTLLQKYYEILQWTLIFILMSLEVTYIMIYDVGIKKTTRADWLSYFLFLLGQDFLITPLLYYLVNLTMLMLTNTRRFKRSYIEFVRFVNRRILSKKFQVLYMRFKKVSPLLKIKNNSRKIVENNEEVKQYSENQMETHEISTNELFTKNGKISETAQVLDESTTK